MRSCTEAVRSSFRVRRPISVIGMSRLLARRRRFPAEEATQSVGEERESRSQANWLRDVPGGRVALAESCPTPRTAVASMQDPGKAQASAIESEFDLLPKHASKPSISPVLTGLRFAERF